MATRYAGAGTTRLVRRLLCLTLRGSLGLRPARPGDVRRHQDVACGWSSGEGRSHFDGALPGSALSSARLSHRGVRRAVAAGAEAARLLEEIPAEAEPARPPARLVAGQAQTGLQCAGFALDSRCPAPAVRGRALFRPHPGVVRSGSSSALVDRASDDEARPRAQALRLADDGAF